MINSAKLDQLALIMQAFTKPWFVAGGWAIDLAIGNVTREHKDIDLCIFREDAADLLSYFQTWQIQVAVPGDYYLKKVVNLNDLRPPRYRLHLFNGNEFLEIFLTEKVNHDVIFIKNKKVKLNLNDFSRGVLPLPFLNPAWELLFKSLDPREEDEHDFIVYKQLVADYSSKKWLLESMIMVNGNQKWITELAQNLSIKPSFQPD